MSSCCRAGPRPCGRRRTGRGSRPRPPGPTTTCSTCSGASAPAGRGTDPVELTPDDVRDVLRVLDSSGLDELHLELTDLTLSVRREGAAGWTAEQQVTRSPVVEGRRGHDG